MRKIFVFIVLSILFSITILPSYNKAHADSCPISLNQKEFPPDFNGSITIDSNNCFATGITYIILGYPKGTSPSGYSLYSIDRKQTSNQASLVGNLNLFSGALGRDNPGPWTLKVCLANTTAECGNPAKILGTVDISVRAVLAPTPTPTPIPSNLPRVFAVPNQCIFPVGSEVSLILDSLQPNTRYQWWWHGDLGVKPDDITPKNSNPSLAFTIPKKETAIAGVRTFCLDMAGSTRGCVPGAQNTLTFQFTPSTPTGDLSCEGFRQSSAYPTISLTPIPPLPQCAQWANLLGTPIPFDQAKNEKDAKCIAVDTAIGQISIEPAKFVQFIFSVVLGLAGGIALLLIIISGYQFMAAQGNPEATKGATERLVSAIVGLLFIIFAFVILQIIGVDILRIPGFNP